MNVPSIFFEIWNINFLLNKSFVAHFPNWHNWNHFVFMVFLSPHENIQQALLSFSVLTRIFLLKQEMSYKGSLIAVKPNSLN